MVNSVIKCGISDALLMGSSYTLVRSQSKNFIFINVKSSEVNQLFRLLITNENTNMVISIVLS